MHKRKNHYKVSFQTRYQKKMLPLVSHKIASAFCLTIHFRFSAFFIRYLIWCIFFMQKFFIYSVYILFFISEFKDKKFLLSRKLNAWWLKLFLIQSTAFTVFIQYWYYTGNIFNKKSNILRCNKHSELHPI